MEKKSSVKTVKDVPALQFINALAKNLKSKLELPAWHDLIKTGSQKQLPPYNPDWYFIRAASLCRRVYIRGGVGVGALSVFYGGRKNNGVTKEHFRRAARGLIRTILKDLEKQNIIAQKEEQKGRWLTKEGQRLMDQVARECA